MAAKALPIARAVTALLIGTLELTMLNKLKKRMNSCLVRVCSDLNKAGLKHSARRIFDKEYL